jgi:acyl carrier protein
MWDKQFEETLRAHLPFLGPDEPLTPEDDLRDLGLDSIGTVELLATLENTYDVRFVDDALKPETFATTGVLWAALAGIAEQSI